MTKIYNRAIQTDRRQRLRRTAPLAEKLLWFRLKGRQLSQFKFRRQFGIGPYILDFYCPTTKLAIEVDGASHHGSWARGYDEERDAFLEAYGIKVIRFTNEQVFHEHDYVIQEIKRQLRILFQQGALFPRRELLWGTGVRG